MVLYQLVYSSMAAKPLGEQELVRLVEQAHLFNRSEAITGILFFSGSQFLQVLEGEQSVIERLYDHICQDPRHTDVKVLLAASVLHRFFPAQGMGFYQVTSVALTRLIGYLDPQARATILPRTCDAHKVMTDLLCEFVEEQTKVPVAWHRAATGRLSSAARSYYPHHEVKREKNGLALPRGINLV